MLLRNLVGRITRTACWLFRQLVHGDRSSTANSKSLTLMSLREEVWFISHYYSCRWQGIRVLDSICLLPLVDTQGKLEKRVHYQSSVAATLFRDQIYLLNNTKYLSYILRSHTSLPSLTPHTTMTKFGLRTSSTITINTRPII